MENETANLDSFLTDIRAVLQQTEQNLQALAQQALIKSQQTQPEVENGRATPKNAPTRQLQQISRQLIDLAEQSRALHNHLLNSSATPLQLDNEYWSRVKILQSQEEERSQLAHQLENGVGQLLANAVFELASCRTLLLYDQNAVAAGLEALQTELESGLADIRRFIVDLEPAAILGNFGLGAGVRRYLEQFETQTGLKTQLIVSANIDRLPSIIETTIFRVIQEALMNAQHHAAATQVAVTMAEKEGALEFSVLDNGQGLAAERMGKSRRNLGLARMVDYAELLNGKLRILSDSQHGTQVILSIPYPEL
jgi:two-component system sensor histidine kinase DegS